MSQLRGPDRAGGGLLPPHDRHLLAVLDGRVASLDPDEFLAVLSLLRRTFGEFAAPEHAAIGSGGIRGAEPGRADPAAQAARHRLEPEDRRQPRPYVPVAPHGDPGAPDRAYREDLEMRHTREPWQ